ncbi:MAG: hypothetical protein QNJ63_15535 [Calothrix sp. MO_192.B10]|nr:hypothetical protein [Calothrix sp. MO_192.B10]
MVGGMRKSTNNYQLSTINITYLVSLSCQGSALVPVVGGSASNPMFLARDKEQVMSQMWDEYLSWRGAQSLQPREEVKEGRGEEVGALRLAPTRVAVGAGFPRPSGRSEGVNKRSEGEKEGRCRGGVSPPTREGVDKKD